MGRLRAPIAQRDPHLHQLCVEIDKSTQQDVADRAGLSQGFVHQLRQGRKDPGFLKVKAVAGALGFELRFVRKLVG